MVDGCPVARITYRQEKTLLQASNDDFSPFENHETIGHPWVRTAAKMPSQTLFSLLQLE
jgi:hypothetical protein